MKYFLDTEFLEGTQKSFFGHTKPTIDLISIGLVDTTGREYYAISNEFNLQDAWSRFDIKTDHGKPQGHGDQKIYWLRENVLWPIFRELYEKDNPTRVGVLNALHCAQCFSYKNLKRLINKYGKSNRVIANDICAFIYGDECGGSGMSAFEMAMRYDVNDKSKHPQFYGYFSAYDWVVFCWLFGRMIDLPKGFPKYCHDLKQMLNACAKNYMDHFMNGAEDFETRLSYLKAKGTYPKQINEHNALADARWNKDLYYFIHEQNQKVRS